MNVSTTLQRVDSSQGGTGLERDRPTPTQRVTVCRNLDDTIPPTPGEDPDVDERPQVRGHEWKDYLGKPSFNKLNRGDSPNCLRRVDVFTLRGTIFIRLRYVLSNFGPTHQTNPGAPHFGGVQGSRGRCQCVRPRLTTEVVTNPRDPYSTDS